jgi:hypothetical protein
LCVCVGGGGGVTHRSVGPPTRTMRFAGQREVAARRLASASYLHGEQQGSLQPGCSNPLWMVTPSWRLRLTPLPHAARRCRSSRRRRGPWPPRWLVSPNTRTAPGSRQRGSPGRAAPQRARVLSPAAATACQLHGGLWSVAAASDRLRVKQSRTAAAEYDACHLMLERSVCARLFMLHGCGGSCSDSG